jgi:hypothetical protein
VRLGLDLDFDLDLDLNLESASLLALGLGHGLELPLELEPGQGTWDWGSELAAVVAVAVALVQNVTNAPSAAYKPNISQVTMIRLVLAASPLKKLTIKQVRGITVLVLLPGRSAGLKSPPLYPLYPLYPLRPVQIYEAVSERWPAFRMGDNTWKVSTALVLLSCPHRQLYHHYATPVPEFSIGPTSRVINHLLSPLQSLSASGRPVSATNYLILPFQRPSPQTEQDSCSPLARRTRSATSSRSRTTLCSRTDRQRKVETGKAGTGGSKWA